MSLLGQITADLAFYFLLVKYLFVFTFIIWLVLLYHFRRPEILLLGAVGFSIYTYAAHALPLNRPYSFRPGGDRMVNLAMSTTAAVGRSPFESYQVASADHEPFWRFLMRLVSFGDPENVFFIYQLLPALTMILVALMLVQGLRNKGTDRSWEVALIVYAVLLLNSSPQDRLGAFQTFWQMTFVLKPNHALGLALIPLWIGWWSHRSFRNPNLWAGILLGLLGWVFLMHWAFVFLGLLMYPLFTKILVGQTSSITRVLRVAGLSLAIVLPYITYLYHFFWGIGTQIEGNIDWPMPGPLEGFLNVFSVGYAHGAIFLLSVAGIVAFFRRRGPVDITLLALLAGCFAGWILYLFAFVLGKAIQAEEFYYYTRFLLSIAAGSGAFLLIQKTAGWLKPHWGDTSSFPVLSLCAFLLVMLPQNISYWWYPPEMDRYYPISLEPVPQEMHQLTAWAKNFSSENAVFVASPDIACWISALSGRRVLLIGDYRPPVDYKERRELMDSLLNEPSEEMFLEAADRFQVSHLVLEDSDAIPEALSWAKIVYEGKDLRVLVASIPADLD